MNLYIDGLYNSKKYKKYKQEIKNIEYFQTPDSYSGSYEGSFIKNNQMILINFGDNDDVYFEQSKVINPKYEKDEGNHAKYYNIWFRQGHLKAFPALQNEKEFPVWQRLHKRLWIFYLWLFCTFITIFLWKTGIRMGFMNKENKNE